MTIAVGLVVLGVALAGCDGVRLPFVEVQACASWVSYETDEERAAGSQAVVVTSSVEPDGMTRIMEYDTNVYLVTVDVAEKGNIAAGDRIRVASTADACGAPYGDADGDPMLDSGPLRLFLYDEGGTWRTITPFDGVRPAT
ncbi:hypothetical protein ACIQLK_05475 [Microbacterium sp. NPDC091382]|uniref:hypothetical protein n=1 Tax=Microbacterium sp. NPDC091382 TaxID=3364210 RepID=UPI00380E5426